MSETTTEHFLIRDEPVQRLKRIVYALSEAARRCEPPYGKSREALPLALAAECAQYGVRVTGEELLLLSGFTLSREGDRIKRLRAGHCARAECDTDQYRLIFLNHPDLDWAQLFSAGEENKAEPAASAEAELADGETVRRAACRRMAIRIGILIFAVILLFVLRQLYLGGRIPLIREPEKFRVDPAPPGGEFRR